MDFKLYSLELGKKDAKHPSSIHAWEIFFILNNESENKLQHENEARGFGSFSCYGLFPHLFVEIKNSFNACVKEECFSCLHIACESET